ncbi:hypothetical protein GCM10028812_46530 [Ancylobacter sonchi]
MAHTPDPKRPRKTVPLSAFPKLPPLQVSFQSPVKVDFEEAIRSLRSMKLNRRHFGLPERPLK